MPGYYGDPIVCRDSGCQADWHLYGCGGQFLASKEKGKEKGKEKSKEKKDAVPAGILGLRVWVSVWKFVKQKMV